MTGHNDSTFEGVGLTHDEEATYLALLPHHGQTHAQIAAALGGRSRAYVTRQLTALVGKGMVNTLAGRPTRYTAISPDVAIESLYQQRTEAARQARQLIPGLMRQFWATQRDVIDVDFVEIIFSPKDGLQRAQQLQRAARTSVRGIDRPPYAGNPTERNTAEFERLPAGVEFRVIYDHAVVEMPERWPDIEASIAGGEQARVLANVAVKVTLFDDWGAILPIVDAAGEVTAGIVVHRSPLLEALSALFEEYWERAVPLALGRPTADINEPTSREQQLITLLSAGLSDVAIRRTLGVSASTVQRDIRDLMARLGATTRFQTGLQLGLRNRTGRELEASGS